MGYVMHIKYYLNKPYMVHQDTKLKQLFTICMLKYTYAHSHTSLSEINVYSFNYPSRIQNNAIYILKYNTITFILLWNLVYWRKYIYDHFTDTVLTENSILWMLLAINTKLQFYFKWSQQQVKWWKRIIQKLVPTITTTAQGCRKLNANTDKEYVGSLGKSPLWLCNGSVQQTPTTVFFPAHFWLYTTKNKFTGTNFP
jgi:hypothetical protein